MGKIFKDYECTGCGACYNICPKDAIIMQGDEYGFYKPFITPEKCVNCGMCEKICPLGKYVSDNYQEPKVFAFQNEDKNILYKSSSGGAFGTFAKYFIENNGIVYGVIFNEQLKVCHSRADNMTDLEKMYSSKYVQSNTNNSFKQAKIDLEAGLQVLFSGTPCQIAGLNSYLQKHYENLITIDLVCHGVPSPLVLEKYKSEMGEDIIKSINFRSKKINGWHPILHTEIITNENIEFIPMTKDNYMRAFLSNLSINNACSNCQYNKIPRIADITIADFWGVENYDKSLNNGKGLSIILINNLSGKKLLNKTIRESLLKEIPLDVAIKFNKNICSSSLPHKNRTKFLKDIANGKSLKSCVKKYDTKPVYLVIYNILPKCVKNFIKYKILKKKNVKNYKDNIR